MRVLLANKYFYLKGGSERCLFTLDELLRKSGHETIHLSMEHPQNRPSEWSSYFVPEVSYPGDGRAHKALQGIGRMFLSPTVRGAVRRLVRDSRPDIAVLHNVYHQLGPSLLRELARLRVPTVMVLHDYKVVCPTYTLLRDGAPCQQCSGGAFWQAARYGCGGGRVRGALLAAEAYWQHRMVRSYDRVDLYCAPSRFLIEKVREMGFPHRVALLRNVVRLPDGPADPARGRAIGYAGRLSVEKGVEVLLAAARQLPGIPLRVAGDGPLLESLRQRAREQGLGHVDFLGHLSHARLQAEMRTWRAAVVPSIWYENCPLAVLEPLALGIPVVGSDRGGIPELLEEGGVIFEPGNADALAAELEMLWRRPRQAARLGAEGRRFVATRYGPDAHLTAFEQLAREAMRLQATRSD